MPYIGPETRANLDAGGAPVTEGELNYVLTRQVNEYLLRNGANYRSINAAIGVLECAKLELYRRIAAPYESEKSRENGDVYTIPGPFYFH